MSGMAITPMMRLYEVKYHDKPIDQIIIEGVRRYEGDVQQFALGELELAPSTLSRWIVQLGLVKRINAIKIEFGHKMLMGSGEADDAVSLQVPPGALLKCRTCKEMFEHHIAPLRLLRTGRHSNSQWAYVRDGEGKTHQFPISRRKLRALRDEEKKTKKVKK